MEHRNNNGMGLDMARYNVRQTELYSMLPRNRAKLRASIKMLNDFGDDTDRRLADLAEDTLEKHDTIRIRGAVAWALLIVTVVLYAGLLIWGLK